MPGKKFKQVCKCASCGNEAEMMCRDWRVYLINTNKKPIPLLV